MSESKQLTFLSAQWKNLALFNYAVPDQLLAPYLPDGCELDRYEGSAYVSIVAFQFLRTRVMGVAWPGFVNFPEINLRFYIRYQGRRGVCFIREHVPSLWVAWMARTLYNEPYRAAQMKGEVKFTSEVKQVVYELTDEGRSLSVQVRGKGEAFLPNENSREHFFKEHDFGVGKSRSGKTLTYEVSHPHWNVYPIEDFKIEIDWRGLYGHQFDYLKNQQPNSVVFAEGSDIKVYWKNS